jgi:predicted nucleotidyltransferase
LATKHGLNPRARVADEAALLLYMGQEKEYKQAKLKAAKTLGARVLPSNAEVAEALDRVAEEREGEERKKRLIAMRGEALEIMKVLREMHPVLTGSVWRGTAHKGSDIDIVVFSDSSKRVQQELGKANYRIIKTEQQVVTKQGKELQTFHIHLLLPSNNEVEIIVRGLDRKHVKEPCEIYGDVQTGLNIGQLEQVLEINPTQKFAPNSAQTCLEPNRKV